MSGSLKDRSPQLRQFTMVGLTGIGLAIILAASPNVHSAETWSKRAPLVEPNSETTVTQIGKKIYVLGGYPSSRITVTTAQEYDGATDKWRLVAPLPSPLNHAMAAAVGGKIYIIGGQKTAGGRRRSGGNLNAARNPFNTNAPDFDWRKVKPRMEAIFKARAKARAEGKGGNASFHRIPAGYSNATYEWEPASNKWTERAPMPTKRSGGAAAVLDGKIYVAGGRTRETGADFAVYNPKTDRWEKLPNVPTQRNHLGVVATAGKIWVVGGRFGPSFISKQSDALEAYDPKTHTWSKMKSMPKPRGGINVVAAAGCIHVFGGEGNSDSASGVWPDHDVYNPKTDSWTSLDPMPIPVHGVTGAAVIDGWIHLPGGGKRIGGSSGDRIHQVVRASLNCL